MEAGLVESGQGQLPESIVEGLFEFHWWDVTERAVEATRVVPVDPLEHGQLDLLDAAPRAVAGDQLSLNNPIVVSARALSKLSPREPTDGVAPASASRSV